ncbi:MAG: GlsB/YeaQ/YmgE family stress response membrane protein [Acidimicrobiales bacterium]|nr:GlsB/YeaQ/YmgE family stress response membrane protein [Acidimicrobiales bacterium]
MLILAILAFGMLIGWLAQLLLGMGTRPNAQSLVAGLVGSFVGGLLVSLIAGDGVKLRPSGLIGSFVGAVVVLLVWNLIRPAARR